MKKINYKNSETNKKMVHQDSIINVLLGVCFSIIEFYLMAKNLAFFIKIRFVIIF